MSQYRSTDIQNIGGGIQDDLGCFGIGDNLEIDRLGDDCPLGIGERDDDRDRIGPIGGFGCPDHATAIVNHDASVDRGLIQGIGQRIAIGIGGADIIAIGRSDRR